MKTPREVLFARHHQAEPKLDAVRQAALAALNPASGAETATVGRRDSGIVWAVLCKAWLELVWPSRQAWAGLATLWIAVLAVNLGMKASSPAPVAPSAPTREVVRGFVREFEEQQRLLTELLPSAEPAPVQAPRPNPGPRSERNTTTKTV